MKVKLLKENKTVEVNDCYGARLIEQGKAVFDCERKQRTAGNTGKPASESGAGEEKKRLKENSLKKTEKGD